MILPNDHHSRIIMPSRRQTLLGGVAAGLLLPHRGLASTSPVWRGLGQNMRWAVQGFSSGSNWSSVYRSRHYSNVSFRYFRIVMQTGYSALSGAAAKTLADADLPLSYHFQVGFEYPFLKSFSGIAARVPVKFSGATIASYAGPGTNTKGYMLSDVIDIGSYIPAGTYFGLWTAVENAAGTHSAANSLPYQANTGNTLQRYSGCVQAANSLISAGTALTASSITAVGDNFSQVFTPCMMLIECAPSTLSVLGIGDSICFGIGEGLAGNASSPNSYGDNLGSALGNAGYLARWVFEGLGHNFVNFGRGSDTIQNVTATKTNWKYRTQLFTLANPTHIVSQNVHNDVSRNTAPNNFVKYAKAAYNVFNTACPGVPILQATCTPDASSTLQFKTFASQTPTVSWGDSSSRRGLTNATIRGLQCGNVGFIDPNPAIEGGYMEGKTTTESSCWLANDITPYWTTNEGVHPTSYGAYAASRSLYASIKGAQVTDPFLAT